MPRLTIDFSGRGGLVERHQGDLNDTAAKPHLRYLSGETQLADGIYNPIKVHGFLAPANAKFASLTGTIANPINSIQYDPEGDVVYFSEEGTNILQLSSLDDTSLANYLTISTGTVKDMVLYEVNQNKALLYAIDSGSTTTGSYVGFNFIDPTQTISLLEQDVVSLGTTPTNLVALVEGGTANTGSNEGRLMAQSFNSSDMTGLQVTGVSMAIAKKTGTASGASIKISIQGTQDRNSGVYTYQGAWVVSTAYAINDTVENNSVTYQCHTAHTSAAGDEPGVGANWEDYWDVFGSPDGTAVAEVTVSVDSLTTQSTDITAREDFTFDSEVVLTDATEYWLVMEEVGTNLTGADGVYWKATTNSNGTYSGEYFKTFDDDGATDYWKSYNFSGNFETADFDLTANQDENWTADTASGAFTEDTGKEMFLYLADNALVYWVVGNQVNTIDGGGTGGATGRVVNDVLTFPSYINVTDITETRSRMYFGVQTSETETGDRRYTARRIGVYVWDRRSQILGSSDYYPCPGAREIKSLFTGHDGNVYAITVGNSGFSELRAISGNQFAVIQTFEAAGYPESRRGVSVMGPLSVWKGKNGIFYGYGPVAPGEQNALHKLGDMSGEAGTGLTSGPILVGYEESAGPRMGVLFAWKDDATQKVQLWYPNGEGTIDTVAQTANAGNVYSPVRLLPNLSNVGYAVLYGIPTTTDSTDDIATLKIYFNMSSTPGITKTITKADMNKGYYEIPINKQNVNCIQFEIEWATDETLGADTLYPYYLLLDYTPIETAGGKTT